MTDKLLTVLEVAEQLRISDESVYRLIRSGKLRAMRVGGLWRVTQDAITALLQEGLNEALKGGPQ